MIAALPMYDRPETAAANDAFWIRIRDALRRLWEDAPERAWPLPDGLTRPDDLWATWLDPSLALSQTCGLPFRERLDGKVTPVGTPDYRLPGCPPGHYNSVFVVRAGDDRTRPEAWPEMTLACNSRNSQSGWAAPQNHMAGLGLCFTDIVLTGAHRESARAVAAGQADIAGIDAQTWRMICRWDADLAGALREVGRTEPTPGLPMITAGGRAADDLRAAVSGVIADLDDEARGTLDLHGFVFVAPERYRAVPTPPFPRATARKIA